LITLRALPTASFVRYTIPCASSNIRVRLARPKSCNSSSVVDGWGITVAHLQCQVAICQQG
jgi:hypothetical protein